MTAQTIWSIFALVLVVAFVFDRKSIRVDVPVLLRGCGLIAFGCLVSFILNSLIGRVPPLRPTLDVTPLLMVWWEDVLFSYLSIFLAHKFLPRKVALVITILASLAFGAGHLYQGYLWAALTCLYPYFISYEIGKKHGYGTVMLLHIFYDNAINILLISLHVAGALK